MSVEVVRRMQKALIYFADKRQLIKVLDSRPLLVGDDLAGGSFTPNQAINCREVCAAIESSEPIAHCVFVLTNGNRLQNLRRQERFLGQRRHVAPDQQYRSEEHTSE